MRKTGLFVAGIFALLFVPGTIPATIAVKSVKYKNKRSLRKMNKLED
jgi:hypothetical protein